MPAGAGQLPAATMGRDRPTYGKGEATEGGTMPAPVFGYSMSRMADQRAREVEAESTQVEPLPPGVDPLDAIDPDLRALVVSTDPPPAATADRVDLGDRLLAGAVGAALGAALGAIVINVGTTSRHQRLTATAGPMDRTHTLAAAVFGAAVGGISGFARGRSPLEQAPTPEAARSRPIRSFPTTPSAAPTHPAFATLYAEAAPA